MNNWQKDPFFTRPLHAGAFHLVLALLLSLVAVADVAWYPPADLQPGQPAPVSYRQTLTGQDRPLVARGQVLDAGQVQLVQRQLSPHGGLTPWRFVGLVVFNLMALVLFNLVLLTSRQKRLLGLRALAAQAVALLLGLLASRLVLSLTPLSSFACPVAFTAMVFATCLPLSHTLALHLLAVALVSPLTGLTRGIMLVPLVAGWAAVMLIRRDSGPWRIMLAAVVGAAAGAVMLAGLGVFVPDGNRLAWQWHSPLVGLLLSMGASGLAAALLLRPLTGLFGEVSASRLHRLLELDHPLLRDLSEKAPGTFQHSLAMANLAEKVAQDIAADGDLVRAGAYYHDIGKMLQPELFIENQREKNPHDDLPPERSAALIRQHIDNGVRLARAARLPERLVDFIIEHHGRSTMDYFLDKASHTAGGTPRIDDFRYHGRNPTSRETAILMIVDSVEAASRTLTDPNQADIMRLLRQILFDKLLAGYLDDSGLTTGDLKRAGRSLVDYLQAQFHVRVPYPWQRVAPAARTPTDPSMRVARPIEGAGEDTAAGPEPGAAADVAMADGEKSDV